MDLTSWMTPWGWLVLAAVLAGIEVFLPGAFMIWIALAALLTGIVTAVTGISWALQLVVFAICAVASIIAGRNFFRRNPIQTSHPSLNRRAEAMIGRVIPLVEPITNGRGRAQVGDSPWLVKGPDMPVGKPVRIVAVDGSALIVEPAEAEDPAA